MPKRKFVLMVKVYSRLTRSTRNQLCTCRQIQRRRDRARQLLHRLATVDDHGVSDDKGGRVRAGPWGRKYASPSTGRIEQILNHAAEVVSDSSPNSFIFAKSEERLINSEHVCAVDRGFLRSCARVATNLSRNTACARAKALTDSRIDPSIDALITKTSLWLSWISLRFRTSKIVHLSI